MNKSITRAHKLQESVYIPSIEGSDIYLNNHHNQQLNIRYVGMIPKSLELEAYVKFGMIVTGSDKPISNDVVNVSFSTKVNPIDGKVKKLKSKLNDTIRQRDEYMKVFTSSRNDEKRKQSIVDQKNQSVERIQSAIERLSSQYWDEMSIEELQDDLYTNGFYIDFYDNKTKMIERIEYIVSHRSSAKSRIGKVLAVRKELYEQMKSWRRMNLALDGREDIDFVSTLAYESLTGSSIVETIELDPKHILVINDHVSKFEHPANLVSVSLETGLLVNKKGTGQFSNKIWDGQALLDEEYFIGTDKSMKLLRQHWFKACAFRCSISGFLMDQAEKKEIDFETWELKDMFNNTVMAKDVKMITTPSALKFLKIAHVVGSEPEMFEHWCETVSKQGSSFGVVKSEKPSKFRYVDGKPIHQMSYQYLNSLPISKEELEELSKYELYYIDQLKNDTKTFVQYALDTADMTNGNEMLVELYRRNHNFARTRVFKNWRSRLIGEYVKRIKRGKLKIVGADYMVLCSNPVEMLYAAIGAFDGGELTLKGKEVYCKTFDWDKKLIGMRSPHTSPSNILSCRNTYNELIDTYLPNLSKNIVVINSIDNPVLDTLSGADMDSDTVWLSDNELLAQTAEESNKSYLPCLGDIGTQDAKYLVCNKDMAVIDNKLKNDYIGRITNIAALLCSHIWDAKEKNEDISDMLDKLSVLSVAQGICIDYAKRIPAISINKVLSDANKLLNELLGDDKQIPTWWADRHPEAVKQYVKQEKEGKAPTKVKFECPMDYLQEIFSNLPNAKGDTDIPIEDLLVKGNAGKANNAQKHIAEDLFRLANDRIKSSHTKNIDDESKREHHVDRMDAIAKAKNEIGRRKMTENTMYALIKNIVNAEINNNTINCLNILYQAQKELFLNCWKKNEFFSCNNDKKAI